MYQLLIQHNIKLSAVVSKLQEMVNKSIHQLLVYFVIETLLSNARPHSILMIVVCDVL